MTIKIFEKKSAVIDITVKEDDVAKTITGGAPRAVLVAPNGGTKTLTAVLTGTKGVIRVTIPNASVDTHGRWIVECALLFNGDDRTVLQENVLAAQTYT